SNDASHLADVSVFLAASGLAAADLPVLLNSQYVNPSPPPLGLSIPDGLCNPNTARLTGLNADPSALDRIRRFVRLSRRLGWSFADLDAALAVLTGGKIDSNMVRVARFERIRRLTQLPIPELLTWWSDIDNTRLGPDGRT